MQRPDHISLSKGSNETLLLMRGIAVYGIIVHNFLMFIPYKSSPPIIAHVVHLVDIVGGTMVHVFFLLSGCGLWLSFKKGDGVRWKQWAYRRFRKIVLPYWIIVTIGFLVAILSRSVFQEGHSSELSMGTLLAYLTFTRNFMQSAHSVNPTLWFMPVIFGLYLLFPVMAYVQDRFGSAVLFVCSIAVTYASIAGLHLGGFSVGHQSALPVFFAAEFALGMIWGRTWLKDGQSSGTPSGMGLLVGGLSAFIMSLVVTKLWAAGSNYNDLLTAIGIGCLLMIGCERLRKAFPEYAIRIIGPSSQLSYLMYLIHGFVILYIVLPIMHAAGLSSISALIAFLLSLVCSWMVYLLAVSTARIVRYGSPLKVINSKT